MTDRKFLDSQATPDHTPRGRGYESSLHYFHHDNSYWDQHYADNADGCAGENPLPIGHPDDAPGSVGTLVDLWLAEEGKPEGPAHGLNNTCNRSFPSNMGDHQKYDRGTSQDYSSWPSDFRNFVTGAGCVQGNRVSAVLGAGAATALSDHHAYEDELFAQSVIQTVADHHARGRAEPLFVFWATHAIHSPLQVPRPYLDMFTTTVGKDDNANHARQIYTAMVRFVDDCVANVTAVYKDTGMWSNTLMVLTSE